MGQFPPEETSRVSPSSRAREVVAGHSGALSHFGDGEFQIQFLLSLGEAPTHVTRIAAVNCNLDHLLLSP